MPSASTNCVGAVSCVYLCITASFVSLRKCVTEHWQATPRLFVGGLVLNDVPMLDHDAVIDAKNVRRDPVRRLPETRESPMQDHELTFRDDHSRLVPQRGPEAFDQVEEAVAAGCDMRTVLDVARRPETRRGLVVPLVEEGIEPFEHQFLVRLFDGPLHFMSFVS